MENTPSEKELVSFRLQKSAKKKLADLAEATGRSQTFLAEEAIEQYYDIQNWQIKAIDEGLKAAEDGRFVPHDEIKKKWETKLADLMD